MTKRIKNVSGSSGLWMGHLIANLAYHEVERDELHRWQMDDIVQADITAGVLLYNNGIIDYTDPTDGLNAWLADDAELIVGVLIDDGAKADGKVLAYNGTADKVEYQDRAAASHTHVEAEITDLGPYVPTSEKGAANGVATLDGGGKVPTSQLNLSNVVYKGTWNATTNTPTLSDGGGGGAQGDYYVVSVAGSTSIDGITDWQVGDWIINNGTVWEKNDNTDQVTSVAGKQGAVTLVEADITDLVHTDANAIHKNLPAEISTVAEKTAPIAADWVLIEDSAAGNAKKKAQIGNLPGGGGGVFGSQFQHSEDETVSTSSSTTYVQKHTWTTTSLPAGDYKIEWSINLGNSTKDAGSWVRVQLDDITDLIESTKGKAAANNLYVPIAGFQIVTLTAATHQIDVDFKAISATAEIKNVRLMLYRVA